MSNTAKDRFEDENCGHCVYHRKDDEMWICSNPDSEYFGCDTEYRDFCDNYEERRPKSRFSVEIKK